MNIQQIQVVITDNVNCVVEIDILDMCNTFLACKDVPSI